MKVLRKVTDTLTFEVEADNQIGLFEQLAKIEEHVEIFGHEKCGACGSPNPYPRVRTKTSDEKDEDGNVIKDKKGNPKQKTFTYYEYVCSNRDCWAVLSFGERLEGERLFPKRKNEDGSYMKNGGWRVWSKSNAGSGASTDKQAEKSAQKKTEKTVSDSKETSGVSF